MLTQFGIHPKRIKATLPFDEVSANCRLLSKYTDNSSVYVSLLDLHIVLKGYACVANMYAKQPSMSCVKQK